MRRVATRILCRSSASSPERVPASKWSIRARCMRSTLRPASPSGSSALTPGRCRHARQSMGRVLHRLGHVVAGDLLLRAWLGHDEAGGLDERGEPPQIGTAAWRRLHLQHREGRQRTGSPEHGDPVERDQHGPVIEGQRALLAALVDGEQRSHACAVADLVDELARGAGRPQVRVQPVVGRTLDLHPRESARELARASSPSVIAGSVVGDRLDRHA